METSLSGEANILIYPNLDAANILFNALKVTGGAGVMVGPILLGAAAPARCARKTFYRRGAEDAETRREI